MAKNIGSGRKTTHYMQTGPGGRHCVCCAEPKDKRQTRVLKRRERQASAAEIKRARENWKDS